MDLRIDLSRKMKITGVPCFLHIIIFVSLPLPSPFLLQIPDPNIELKSGCFSGGICWRMRRLLHFSLRPLYFVLIVSLGVGPWDALFGGGNIPAFVLASLCAFAAGVIASLKLPNLSSSSFKSSGFHFG